MELQQSNESGIKLDRNEKPAKLFDVVLEDDHIHVELDPLNPKLI